MAARQHNTAFEAWSREPREAAAAAPTRPQDAAAVLADPADARRSPALDLQRQLIERLSERKWPRPLRLAVALGLGAAVWAAIIAAIAAVA